MNKNHLRPAAGTPETAGRRPFFPDPSALAASATAPSATTPSAPAPPALACRTKRSGFSQVPAVKCLAGLLVSMLLFSCQHGPPPNASAFADLSSTELTSALADLARSNDQKTQLAFYASLPWQGVTPPFDAFYKQMGSEQKELYAEITDWAKKNHIDLTYHYSKDIPGEAQKILEARQEKLVRGDSKADFTRDTLMQMYQDYEWQISEVQALLPHVKDPELKAYLEHSLKVHTAGDAQLVSLLQRFKA